MVSFDTTTMGLRQVQMMESELKELSTPILVEVSNLKVMGWGIWQKVIVVIILLMDIQVMVVQLNLNTLPKELIVMHQITLA